MSGVTTVYDLEEEIESPLISEENESVDNVTVVIHVTAEEYGYFRHEFRQDANGDFIRISENMEIEVDLAETTNNENSIDTNYYIRISKSRYTRIENRYIRNDSNGTFVKVANRDGELIEINGEPLMVRIQGVLRYRKGFVVVKNHSTWNRTVQHYKKVPTEFGTHIRSELRYGVIRNRGEQTTAILRTLYNYNELRENIDYGLGTQFQYFLYTLKVATADGDYIRETLTNINDWGDKWSPDSGSADTTANYNHKPYCTYRAYLYRSDDFEDESIENPMTAREKLEADINNEDRNNAVKGNNNEPIIYEIARHTRTNNFSYYRKGGPTPPNGFEDQPEYYEINYVPSRFRIVLPEENHEQNFRSPGTSQIIRNVTNTYNNKSRDAISLDKYSSSNDLEGCLGILGRLQEGRYLAMANGTEGYTWNTWNNLLIEHIPELGEVFGRAGHTSNEIDTIDTRTRVFMKVDPLPDVPSNLIN